MSDRTGPAWPAVESELPESSVAPAVDAALRAVVEAAGVVPCSQIPAYEAAHRTLREALARIDES